MFARWGLGYFLYYKLNCLNSIIIILYTIVWLDLTYSDKQKSFGLMLKIIRNNLINLYNFYKTFDDKKNKATTWGSTENISISL